MYPFRRETLQTINLTVATDAGQRKYTQLSQNSFTYLVYFVLRVTVLVAGASVTSVKFPGSAAQAFDFVGINENGFDRVLIDPRIAAFIGQMRSQSALSNVRMGAITAATYNLVEVVPVWFSNPNSLNPGETAFRERNPTALTQAFVQLSTTAAANIAVPGAATVMVTAASVDVIQVHNPNQKTLPWFVPFISQQLVPVSGANANQRITLMTDRFVSALVVSGESTLGLVPDAINNLRLLSDVRTYIGPQMQPWDVAGRMSELYFGGAVYTPNLAAGTTPTWSAFSTTGKPYAVGFDFQHHGQLSTMIEPNETNLRLEIDCQPSAFGTSTNLRITTIEMVRDMQEYTAPGGGVRRVCRPGVPAWLNA